MSSNQDQGFTIIRNDIFDTIKTMGRSAFVVYSILAKFANREGICFPSREIIGEIAGLSAKQVGRVISNLVEANLVSKESKSNGRGKGRFNTYHLKLREATTVSSKDTNGHPCPSASVTKGHFEDTKGHYEPLREDTHVPVIRLKNKKKNNIDIEKKRIFSNIKYQPVWNEKQREVLRHLFSEWFELRKLIKAPLVTERPFNSVIKDFENKEFNYMIFVIKFCISKEWKNIQENDLVKQAWKKELYNRKFNTINGCAVPKNGDFDDE